VSAPDPAPGSSESEEHRIGALLLAVASLSHQGYVKLRRSAAVWGVGVYSPRQVPGRGERYPYLAVTGETLREALEAAWERLRAEQGRMGL
jgi:hypothetical protein